MCDGDKLNTREEEDCEKLRVSTTNVILDVSGLYGWTKSITATIIPQLALSKRWWHSTEV